MKRETLDKAGLVALALLVPGGMILGGALAWRRYRARKGSITRSGSDDPPRG